MKQTLSFLITLLLFFSSSLRAMAMFSHPTSEEVKTLTVAYARECKGDGDDKCQ